MSSKSNEKQKKVQEDSYERLNAEFGISEESLPEEVKDFLRKHKSKSTETINQLETLEKRPSDTTTPSTIMRGSTPNLTPLATASSSHASLQRERTVLSRTCINITDTLQENKNLKAEVVNLRLQMYILKNQIPRIVDADGRDFTDKYLEMDKNLQEAMTRHQEAEEKIKRNSKKYAEDVAKLKADKKRLSEELNKCVADQKELEHHYKSLREELAQRRLDARRAQTDDGNDSGSVSIISSFMSEKEVEADKLRSIIFKKEVELAKLEKEMDELRNQLQKTEEGNRHLSECLNEKESELRQMKAARVGDMSDSSKKEIEDLKAILQSYEENLKTEADKHDAELKLRDRAINVMRKALIDAKVKETDVGVGESLPSSNENFQTEVQYSLDRLAGIDEEALSFARDVISVHSGSDEEYLRMKLEEFDRLDDLVKEPRSSVLERSSVAACDLLNVSANVYSRSFTTANELRRCKESLKVIEKVSLRLFEKLHSSAKFLESLLEELGQGEKGRALMDEVTALRLDLNTSLNDLLEASRQIDAAEKSITEFSMCFEQSMSCFGSQMRVASFDPKQAEYEKGIRQLKESRQQLILEKENVQRMDAECRRLKTALEEKQLICERLEKALIESENNLTRALLEKKQVRVPCRDSKPKPFTLNEATMTDLYGQEFNKIEDQLKTLLAFANRLRKLTLDRSGKSSISTRNSFSSADLEEIYQFYSANLVHLEGAGILTKEVTANNEKSVVTSHEHDQGYPEKTYVLSSSNSDQPIEESWKLAKVTSTEVKKHISELNNVIQKLRQYSKLSKRDVDQMLTVLRTLRAFINDWRNEIGSRSEENVVPQASFDSLIEKNNELQTRLVEAQQLLDEARNLLYPKASAGDMCERIVGEMRRIKDALKASRRDIASLQSQKHKKEKQ